jgi:hypothetical protein
MESALTIPDMSILKRLSNLNGNHFASVGLILLCAAALLSGLSSMSQRRFEMQAIVSSAGLNALIVEGLRDGRINSSLVDSIKYRGAAISGGQRQRFRYEISIGKCSVPAFVSYRAMNTPLEIDVNVGPQMECTR